MSKNKEVIGKNTVGETITLYGFITAFLIGLSSIGVLGYQIYFWLRHGYWKSLSAGLVLEKVLPNSFFQWIANDASWLGVKKIILYIFKSSLASFLFLFALGLLVLVFVIVDFADFLEKGKKAKDKQK
jgi:hypothetical protein